MGEEHTKTEINDDTSASAPVREGETRDDKGKKRWFSCQKVVSGIIIGTSSGVISGLIISVIGYLFVGSFSYEVTFDSNGSDFKKETVVVHPLRVKNKVKDILRRPDSVAGFVFHNWSLDPTNNIPIAPEALSGIRSPDVTIYAIWDYAKYTIRFDPNGGSCDRDTMIYTIKHCAPLPTGVTKVGYLFKGWVDKADPEGSYVTAVGLQEKPKHIKLLAKWIKIESTEKGKTQSPQSVVTFEASGFASKERAINYVTEKAEEQFKKMYPGISYDIDEPKTEQNGINWSAKVVIREKQPK